MDQPAVECSSPSMEVNQPADLSLTRISKCPKPFSIESIISTNANKSPDLEANIPQNYEKLPNPNMYFPANVSMAAAASLYNPWFHNYFMQQQKAAGNMLEMMQLNPTSHSAIKEKFTEIFANNSGPLNDSRGAFLTIDPSDRNAPPMAPRSIEQYIGSVENIHEMRINEMINSANNEYYKHLSSYGINCISQQTGDNLVEQCKSQLNTNGDENETNFLKNDKDRYSDYDKGARNDDSGADENGDDDIDSDCNSEISLDMSPDGDNNTQGNRTLFLLLIW